METMGPIPNSGSKQWAFPNASPTTQWPRARKERDGSPRRPGGRGFSLAVGTMLAVILISSASSAETSPRGELEDFFGRVTTVAERGALVRTEVQARYGNDMQLDYLMARSGKGWLVRDVVIDGVSLVENYRAQFARILRTSSYADLVLRFADGGRRWDERANRGAAAEL